MMSSNTNMHNFLMRIADMLTLKDTHLRIMEHASIHIYIEKYHLHVHKLIQFKIHLRVQ